MFTFKTDNMKENELEIDRQELSSTNYQRDGACNVYIEELDRIIVGGGYNRNYEYYGYFDISIRNNEQGKTMAHSIEIYDIHKDKWSLYPYQTHFDHSQYGLLWYDNVNPNIVYFSGRSKDGGPSAFFTDNNPSKYYTHIEFIDLRNGEQCKQSKWMKIQNKSLEVMLDVGKHRLMNWNVAPQWENKSCFINVVSSV